MRPSPVLSRLGEPGCLEAVRPGWEKSASRAPASLPPFLQPEQFREARRFAGLPSSAEPVLEAAAARIRENPDLGALAWHAHQTLVASDEQGHFAGWPSLDRAMGELAGAFYMLVGLAAVPVIRDVHGEMGVPEQITRDTCHVLVCLSWNYERSHPARLGIMLKELFWVRNHLKGRLFRIGRLEFMIGPFQGCLQAYRHRTSGRVLALATDGSRFTEEGYLPYRGYGASPGEWTASLEASDGYVSGCPITPWGVAVRQRARLPLNEWQLELQPGQPSVEFHIPEGGGMTPDRCLDSMRRGLRFFAEFFPDTPVSGFHSHSWIFGPQLEDYLPNTSNLVRLLREVYLFPIPTTPRDGLYYLFGSDDIDLETAPRDTSLRRATIDYLAAGGPWRCGGMFIRGNDLQRFGSQVYRSGWAPALAETESGGR